MEECGIDGVVHDCMCVNSRRKGEIRIGNSETGNLRERKRKKRAV